MSAYLDTHVVIWLCENKTAKLSPAALGAINENDLLVTQDEKIREHYPKAVW
jgi:PIN domain nuclease of toxin-antitoxin system